MASYDSRLHLVFVRDGKPDFGTTLCEIAYPDSIYVHRIPETSVEPGDTHGPCPNSAHGRKLCAPCRARRNLRRGDA